MFDLVGSMGRVVMIWLGIDFILFEKNPFLKNTSLSICKVMETLSCKIKMPFIFNEKKRKVFSVKQRCWLKYPCSDWEQLGAKCHF